jgi:hypothetical protein
MPPPIPCNSSSISSLAANKTSFTEILKAAYLATNKKNTTKLWLQKAKYLVFALSEYMIGKSREYKHLASL